MTNYSYGAGILDSKEGEDRGFDIKHSFRSIPWSYKIPHVVVVYWKALHDTINTYIMVRTTTEVCLFYCLSMAPLFPM